VNHGELIEPARALPKVSLPVVAGVAADSGPWAGLTGKWSLVYVGEGSCDESCRHALVQMRQTRLALNNDMTRVQRVFLATGHCCALEDVKQEHPGLVVVDASGAAAAPLLLAFPQNNPSTSANTSVFLVDPLGNLMMRYDTRENSRGMLLDLQKLLRLSHIG
jgi:cytochrome oxidase Cu insertion factor (SCO1/SenC/PrrC family)